MIAWGAKVFNLPDAVAKAGNTSSGSGGRLYTTISAKKYFNYLFSHIPATDGQLCIHFSTYQPIGMAGKLPFLQPSFLFLLMVSSYYAFLKSLQ